MRPSTLPPEHMSKIINFRCSDRSLHTNIHSSIIYNTQKKNNSNTIKTLKGSLLKGGGGFTSFSWNSQETPSRKSHEPFQICHALLTPKSDRAISVWNCHQLWLPKRDLGKIGTTNFPLLWEESYWTTSISNDLETINSCWDRDISIFSIVLLPTTM